MKVTKMIISVLLGLMSLLSTVFAAPDYAREQRWADEILPGIMVGEAVYLQQTNQHRFLGLLAVADNAKMALVIVHGMGIHPDWGMVGTLRRDLFDHGYTTLSIQMPVLAADASYTEYPAIFPDAIERLQLSVAYLKQKGYQRLAIVSHSNGSRMTRGYMVENPKDVIAWAALSLTQGDTFAGIKAPVLDLYAEYDLPHVVGPVARRKASLANSASIQREIKDTNHFFVDHEGEMVNAVKDFLESLKTQGAAQISNLTEDPTPFCPSWD